jgi:Xaa-Pro aminopeptidase
LSNLPSKFDSNSGLSRRDLLRAASASAAVSLAEPAISWSQAASSADNPTKGRAANSLTAASMPQGWTLDEIHRRWQKVRTLMKAAQLDCLLLPGAEPDGLYLSASSASWVVFPYDGRPAAIFPGREPLPVEILGAGAGARERSSEKSGEKFGEKGGEKNAPDLGMDLRSPRTEEEGMVSPLLVDVLREKGMAQARIGVSNLQDVYRNLEGNVNYTTYDHVLKAFPQSKFVPASDLMMRVKLVRSPEEIAVLEKATQVGEAGLRAMFATARPGVTHREVWTNVWRTMWEASGEYPRVSIAANAQGATTHGRPVDEALSSGAVLAEEITSSVLGYQAQVNHSVAIGTAPADWDSAAKYSIEVFNNLLEWIAPGKTYKEFVDFYGQKQEARGTKPQNVVLWTCGFGDGPRSGPGGRTEGVNLSFEAGQVFDLKPVIAIRDGKGALAQFGDSVLVTEKGARRLGTRKLEVMSLGG